MPTLRQTVLIVALLNLAYFGVEFVAALRAGSVSLLADSADLLEDAAINLLIFFALVWTATRRAEGSLTRAAFLSARNDAFANIGIIAAGLITARHPSIWPDILSVWSSPR